MKLREQKFWPPALGVTLKVAGGKTPTFDLSAKLLEVLDLLPATKGSPPEVTIRVQLSEPQNLPRSDNFVTPNLAIQRQLHELLLRQVGRTMQEIGELPFN
jgi:hypothetical protein